MFSEIINNHIKNFIFMSHESLKDDFALSELKVLYPNKNHIVQYYRDEGIIFSKH